MASKRSGGKAKSRSATRRAKSKVERRLKDLQVRNAKGVRGGAKGDPVVYLKVKMSDIIITG